MLTDKVSTLYTDDQLNFVFKTHNLEKFEEVKNTTSNFAKNSLKFLRHIIEKNN